MLRLVGEQVESLFDEALPLAVRELPDELARLDALLSDPGVVGADRAAVGGGGARARATDDPDGAVRAADGGQAAHRVGL
jgi:hypothetical protein